MQGVDVKGNLLLTILQADRMPPACSLHSCASSVQEGVEQDADPAGIPA